MKLNSIEKYLATCTIDKILQDARLVLESDNQVARNVLAGTILVALDQIELFKMVNDFQKMRKNCGLKVKKQIRSTK